jgi:hypothetical protein
MNKIIASERLIRGVEDILISGEDVMKKLIENCIKLSFIIRT